MIIIDCDQLSPEWFAVKAGIPSASRFGSIITPMGKRSNSPAYMRDLLAEWLSGKKLDDYQSGFMQRGIESEKEAHIWYEFQREVELQHVGFIMTDDKLAGCSPDGLIGINGGLEGKAPGHRKHMETLITQKIPPEYIPQIQGNLYITGREWWDFLSYHPDLPPFLVRVKRDEDYIKKLKEYLHDFQQDMMKNRQMLIDRGYKRIEI